MRCPRDRPYPPIERVPFASQDVLAPEPVDTVRVVSKSFRTGENKHNRRGDTLPFMQRMTKIDTPPYQITYYQYSDILGFSRAYLVLREVSK